MRAGGRPLGRLAVAAPEPADAAALAAPQRRRDVAEPRAVNESITKGPTTDGATATPRKGACGLSHDMASVRRRLGLAREHRLNRDEGGAMAQPAQ